MPTLVLAFRVQFFRLHAAYNRYREEQEILEAEHEHTTTWFTKTGNNWGSIADNPAGRSEGWVAFAREKASMNGALAVQSEKEWEKKHYLTPKPPKRDSE
jgi:hypothetical protein